MPQINNKFFQFLIVSCLSCSLVYAEQNLNETKENVTLSLELQEYYSKVKELNIQKRTLYKNLSPAAKAEMKILINNKKLKN